MTVQQVFNLPEPSQQSDRDLRARLQSVQDLRARMLEIAHPSAWNGKLFGLDTVKDHGLVSNLVKAITTRVVLWAHGKADGPDMDKFESMRVKSVRQRLQASATELILKKLPTDCALARGLTHLNKLNTVLQNVMNSVLKDSTRKRHVSTTASASKWDSAVEKLAQAVVKAQEHALYVETNLTTAPQQKVKDMVIAAVECVNIVSPDTLRPREAAVVQSAVTNIRRYCWFVLDMFVQYHRNRATFENEFRNLGLGLSRSAQNDIKHKIRLAKPTLVGCGGRW